MTINCNGNIPGFVKWSVGYPNAATAGELYVTNLQITGPGGATYIEDGDFAGGQHMSEYSAYTSKADTISIVPVDGWAVPTVSPTEMPTATLVPSISLEPSALPISAPSASPMLGPTSSPSQSPNPTPPPTPQRSANYVALSALYVATNGAGWSSKENWMTGSEPCEASWDNVACDATTNTKIYSVNLNSMNLQGTLPTGKGPLIICALPIFSPSFTSHSRCFFPPIAPPEIGLLTHMRSSLQLASNELTGTVPSGECECTIAVPQTLEVVDHLSYILHMLFLVVRFPYRDWPPRRLHGDSEPTKV